VTDDGYKEANLLASDAIINYKVLYLIVGDLEFRVTQRDLRSV
jgi:hypothetical protein